MHLNLSSLWNSVYRSISISGQKREGVMKLMSVWLSVLYSDSVQPYKGNYSYLCHRFNWSHIPFHQLHFNPTQWAYRVIQECTPIYEQMNSSPIVADSDWLGSTATTMKYRNFAYQEMTSTTSPLLEPEGVRVCAISNMDWGAYYQDASQTDYWLTCTWSSSVTEEPVCMCNAATNLLI